jgi:hypothetical protein
MRKYTFKSAVILLIISFVSNAFAKEVFISLKPDTLLSPNRKFYIQDVIDSRPDTSNIGFAQDPTWETKRIAKFEKGFSKEILEYYNSVLPKQEGQTPIVMEFRDFNVSYSFNAFRVPLKVKNKVTSDILFYTIQDSMPVLCYETSLIFLMDDAPNVSKNIKELLRISINSFSFDHWKDTTQFVSYPENVIVRKEEKPLFKNKILNFVFQVVIYGTAFILIVVTA